MTARRMERAPTADDSRPEEYDDTGIGARAKPISEAEPEPELKRSQRIRTWMRMRKKGWRKNPHGHGWNCPDASCLVAGDFQTRIHHNAYHDDVWAGFAHADKLIDELWDEIDALRDELEKALAQRDQVIASMDRDTGYMSGQIATLVEIHSIQHVPTHEPPEAESSDG